MRSEEFAFSWSLSMSISLSVYARLGFESNGIFEVLFGNLRNERF